jgi:hypothetical protein
MEGYSALALDGTKTYTFRPQPYQILAGHAERPGDQQVLHPRAALAYLEDLRVPLEPAHRGLVHEARTGEDPGRVTGVIHGRVGGDQLGD